MKLVANYCAILHWLENPSGMKNY